MRNGNLFARKPRPFWRSALKLTGHLVAAGAIFIVFFAIVWLVSCALTWLDSIHHFPPEIFVMITKVEVWLTYADWGLCIVVLATGTWRFITDIVRGDQ